MKKAFLTRPVLAPDRTYGRFELWDGLQSLFACYTLELPWKNNARQISCIPTGTYIVKHEPPNKSFPYNHYRVLDVPGRSGILIHRGSLIRHTLGCILVGSNWEDIDKDDKKDLTGSKVALDRIWELVGTESFSLTVAA